VSFRLIAETPVIAAAPGEVVVGRVRVHNDATTDAVYTVSVVGIDPDPVSDLAGLPTSAQVPVAAGASAVIDIAVAVPRSLGIGQHAAAFEATSNRANDRAALTPFTLSIASVARVELVPHPSTIRARRRANFHLDVTNNEAQPVEIELIGEAPDVRVSFTPSVVGLSPGQRVVARARLKGPRHLAGEPTQHNILITARGRAATTTTTAAYIQRPLFAQRLRMVVAAVTVVALWFGAIAGVAVWWSNRDVETTALYGVDTDGDGIIDEFLDAEGSPVTGVDTDGDGIPDQFIDADGQTLNGTDTNGDGIPDTIVGRDGTPVVAIDTNGDGIPDALSNGAPRPDDDEEVAVVERQTTVVRGSVDIAADPTTVDVTLTALTFNDPDPETATPVGLRRSSSGESSGKFWPARYGSLVDLFDSPVRRTVAIAAQGTQPDGNGSWLFSDVIQGQSYEVSFRSPGFDTQSFVVTPDVDGDAVALDVEMQPSRGALSGTVVGPGGPLGSAAITISDGTMTFSTSSEGGTGAWSLDGISTPGIYTVSAELRGFGTSVQQVELGPADTASDITIRMAAGLGTITGRIEDTGRARLGGVTVTASNGETTLTTTTFTEGDIGFYSLPQLDVPGSYTVQAELDGYIVESRRVTLNGSVQNDVNFTMTSTTAQLTGRVLSSAGGGIEGAGLIISTGDLQFRASTAAAPDAGVFNLDRLPPGDYTITAEHFEHETSTQFITLVAGRRPAPLVITLTKSGGPPPVGTGSLTVNVVNDDPTIEPRGITGTIITVTRLRSDFQRTIQNEDDSTVTFTDLPVGTYSVSINATALGYNNSAPERRSVGLGGAEPVTFALQRLGTASGSVINSLDRTGPALRGYNVSLYRLANINDPVGQFFNSYSEANGIWDTGEKALQTGFWRMEVSSPTGFLVRNNQVIDLSPAVNGRPMVFLVPSLDGVSVLPQTILPVEADPLASITGKIYRPRLTNGVLDFIALDDNSLAVTGTCNGVALPATSIVISSTFGANNLVDTFFLSPTNLAGVVPPSALPTTCVFQVSAAGRVSETVTFTNVGASNGTTPADRVGAAALVRTPQPLGGSVFWIDPGQDPDARVALGDVAIASVDRVIVDFTPTLATSANPDPRPGVTTQIIDTTSLGGSNIGEWDLQGQIFGTAVYRFTTGPDQFNPGAVQVTINDDGRTVAASGVNTIVSNDPGSRFGVQLTPPKPGTLSGQVSIRSERSPKSFADAVATATTPSGATPKPTRTPDASGGFSFASAEAGTWKVEFATPDNHQLLSNLDATPPGSVTDQLLPGDQTLSGFDVDFVELGALRINAYDRSTGDAITAPLAIDLTDPGGIALTGPVPDRALAEPDDGTAYTLDGIPVSADPSNGDVNYGMALSLDDVDLTRARSGSASGPQVDATALTLAMNAGRDTTLDLHFNPFRSITGSLLGLQTSGLPEGLSLDQDSANPATMPVTRVDRFGTPITTSDPAPRLVPGPDGTFSIVAPPGFYKLAPSHPQYVDTPVQLPAMPPITDTELPPGETLPDGVFELRADADTELEPYEFRLRRSELSVRALTRLAGGTPVEGAVFDLELDATSCNGFPATGTSTPIGVDGTTISVAPGSYCLAINKFEGASQVAFPAVVLLTVPRSTATVSTTTVVAPLPSLRPELTGKLVAQNADGATVELNPTDPLAVKVTARFTEAVAVSVDGDSVSNLTPETSTPDGSVSRTANAVITTTLPGVPWDGSWTYELKNVPYGANTVTAPDVGAAYATPAAQTVIIISDDGPTNVPDFVYRVATAPIEINLGTGIFPSLDGAFDDDKVKVSLSTQTVTGLDAEREYSLERRSGSNILVVQGVAPTSGVSRLSFSDVLHAPVLDRPVSIPLTVDSEGRRVGTLNPGPTATKVRWTGVVQQRTQPDSNPNDDIDDGLFPLQAGAVMTLVSTSPTGPTYRLAPDPTEALPNSPGAVLDDINFQFDVAPGTYNLTVTKSGYTTATVPGISLPTAGTLVTRAAPVVIDREATITINTTTFASLPAPSGLTVRLVDKNAPTAVLQPRSSSEPNVYDVRPGTYYAEATANAPYPRQQSPDVIVVIGGQPQIDLVLPRVAQVRVTGVASPTEATVALVGVTTPPAQSGTTPRTFQFIDPPTAAAPAVLRAKVSAPDHRTQIVDVPTAIINEPAVLVDLKPNVTITGTIAGATSGTVTATATDALGGITTRTGTVASNSYTIADLGVGPDGETRVWTLTYTQLGTGTTDPANPVTVEVTSTNAPTGPAIVLTVRNIAYNFNVSTATPPVSSALSGATAEILNGAGVRLGHAPTVSGLATVSVAENTSPARWRVTHPDRLTRSGALGALSLAPSPIAVQLQPAVTGTVVDSSTPAVAVVGASVIVCPSTATAAPCATPGEADRSTTSGAGGAFKLNSELSPSTTYVVWAISGTERGSVTLTTNAEGRASLSNSTIKIDTPPPPPTTPP
jgi:hypothetical protein